MASQVIVSRSEAERVEQLGKYFRDFLQDWFTQLITGIRYSPDVMRELTIVLLEFGAAALIATSETAQDEADEDTADRCKRAAKEAFAVLEREVLS